MSSSESDEQTPSDGEWRRRFTGSEPRLSEVVEMYERLGFEVRIETLGGPTGTSDICTGCAVNEEDVQKSVYTRKPD